MALAADQETARNPETIRELGVCSHCGVRCRSRSWEAGGKVFCCAGCRSVYELLHECGLERYYRLGVSPGISLRGMDGSRRFDFLDDRGVEEKILDYSDGRMSRVTLRIPAIHCSACVWLLENLFRLRAGIGVARVNFLRKEMSVVYEEGRITLRELVELLVSLGYEPELTWDDGEGRERPRVERRLWLQMGVAGFAFGNIMLFSLPAYLGMDAHEYGDFRNFFGWLSLLLAVPVLVFSASDYWRAAWLAVRRGVVTIEVPIALGIVALFSQSAYEIGFGVGEGYLDSFSGLVFLLLCGRMFQRKTYDRLAFDRDYRSFFPLAVRCCRQGTEEDVSISRLRIGDRLCLRHGELIPADSRLCAGEGWIDYGFVTGESDPVTRRPGDYLYAGGRQLGGRIEVETVKSVSQSYLTSLWNAEAFQGASREAGLDTATNRVSRYFTGVVVAIALGAAGFWAIHDSALVLRSFIAVLIVACPCALALAAPFTLGTGLRRLGRHGIFLRSGEVIEALAGITAVVLDKTGTLTRPQDPEIRFCGDPLSPEEERAVASLAGHSVHPYSVRIARGFEAGRVPVPVEAFREVPGAGISGHAGAQTMHLGSADWLSAHRVTLPDLPRAAAAGSVHLAIDGVYRGEFRIAQRFRPGLAAMLHRLRRRVSVHLLTGDHPREQVRLRKLIGSAGVLAFRQSPHDKLRHVRYLQSRGHRVLMVGDGLNDAGALKQSEVGLAVSEAVGAFSPASDGILDAHQIIRLDAVVAFARASVRIIHASFLISLLYNAVGISLAARGSLSPLVCAVLMPLSSVTVIGFACGMTEYLGRRAGLGKPRAGFDSSPPVTQP